MPVIRATKDKDFTVMSIHHLRDTRLSLKAIGLFSIILSLPLKRKFYFNFVSFPPFPTFSAKSHALPLHFRTTYPCGQNPRKKRKRRDLQWQARTATRSTFLRPGRPWTSSRCRQPRTLMSLLPIEKWSNRLIKLG